MKITHPKARQLINLLGPFRYGFGEVDQNDFQEHFKVLSNPAKAYWFCQKSVVLFQEHMARD